MDWSSWGAPPQGSALVLHALSANADLPESENFNAEGPASSFPARLRTLSEPLFQSEAQNPTNTTRSIHSAGPTRVSAPRRRKSQSLLDDVHKAITADIEVDPVPAYNEAPVSRRIDPHETREGLGETP
eukprot:CAMPEP_0184308774 /NCGR_PEP_ID=MMETSP1049-20130417/17134_1 /TAXON_ID=77928 /ORGANISM="Proteomonas sulcata, Strain CCMP704" /LENGTH=128 /DNA_ID=CAMNT_0026621523 /DNA_START=49 /DNA_END=432 /DNA_ORIENTATION=-